MGRAKTAQRRPSTGKGALDLTEELAGKDLTDDGRTVDGDEWLVRAAAERVNRTCDQFLARAIGAADQNP